MPFAIFTFKLNSGTLAAEYERWVRLRDRPLVEGMTAPHGPILSQQIARADAAVFGGDSRFDYIERLEFTDRQAFLQTLSTHPNAMAISNEAKAYVTFVDNFFISEV